MEHSDQISYEVELKFRLPLKETSDAIDEPKKVFCKKLMKNKFEFSRVEEQVDMYFQHPCKNFAKSDEALRIRQVRALSDSPPIISTEITYKGPKLLKISKTRKELALTISQVSIAEELFEALGFKRVFKIQKTREIWIGKYKGMEISISLDFVTELGSFVELETLTTQKEKIKEFSEQLLKLSKKLGLEDEIRKSYLELRLEKE